MKKAEFLIVDTSAFIRNAQLQEIAENVITLEDVLNEIKCHKQLKGLVVLPYELKVKNVNSENIKIVSDFSKKTGDYPNLSATDIKVMALTYQLEKEYVGTDHLRTEPIFQKTIENYSNSDMTGTQPAGFYSRDYASQEYSTGDVDLILSQNDSETSEVNGESEEDYCDKSSEKIINSVSSHTACEKETVDSEVHLKDTASPNKENTHEIKASDSSSSTLSDCVKDNLTSNSAMNSPDGESVCKNKERIFESGNDVKAEKNSGESDDHFDSCEEREEEYSDLINDLSDMKLDENMLQRLNHDHEYDAASDDDSIYDDDDCGWITPSNVVDAKKDTEKGILEDRSVKVACLTTDFSMQNVLKQMGLNILSLDGKVIREVRTYILRCHACFKTTSNMDKVFCPKCGLKTLKRVSVKVDEEGKQHIFINFKRPLTARGKRFPIPRFKGGKYAQNPILVEDQRVPQQRLSKKALQKTNPLDPDYIAGFSPFVMRDTTSRSVMLGFHTKSSLQQLRNPNCRRKKKGKK